jgi:hypothetical protein
LSLLYCGKKKINIFIESLTDKSKLLQWMIDEKGKDGQIIGQRRRVVRFVEPDTVFRISRVFQVEMSVYLLNGICESSWIPNEGKDNITGYRIAMSPIRSTDQPMLGIRFQVKQFFNATNKANWILQFHWELDGTLYSLCAWRSKATETQTLGFHKVTIIDSRVTFHFQTLDNQMAYDALLILDHGRFDLGYLPHEILHWGHFQG